ncbi:hypothetical protein CEXT_951 [Caerostris extrusa]|uniref:Uncharacterized protein n=1 Tax=Caerostris extrusa TaxID=172846 RepID=A0AAV4TQT1_CAEEX|nr:hypothetical protein CEXT_951 [Caerostris extrusa]
MTWAVSLQKDPGANSLLEYAAVNTSKKMNKLDDHCDNDHSVTDDHSVINDHSVIDDHRVIDDHSGPDDHSVINDHSVSDDHSVIDHHSVIDRHSVIDDHSVIDHHSVIDDHSLFPSIRLLIAVFNELSAKTLPGKKRVLTERMCRSDCDSKIPVSPFIRVFCFY